MYTGIAVNLIYEDMAQSIDWLLSVFGFESKMIYKDDSGHIVHAEIRCGQQIIMISSAQGSPFSEAHLKTPRQSKQNTQAIYVIMPDDEVSNLYEKVKSSGAPILVELESRPYGGQDFTCQDAEDYIWSFGSYDPYSN